MPGFHRSNFYLSVAFMSSAFTLGRAFPTLANNVFLVRVCSALIGSATRERNSSWFDQRERRAVMNATLMMENAALGFFSRQRKSILSLRRACNGRSKELICTTLGEQVNFLPPRKRQGINLYDVRRASKFLSFLGRGEELICNTTLEYFSQR